MTDDLWSEIEGRMRLLDTALREYASRGRLAAEAERSYREALAKEELTLKAEGHPATLIRDLARGSKEVARLAFERDCAEALYESAGEAINVFKLTIRVLEGELAREWGTNGKD